MYSSGTIITAPNKGSRIAFTHGGRLASADAVSFATGNLHAKRLSEYLEAFLVLQYESGTPWSGAPAGAHPSGIPSLVAATLAHAGVKPPAVASPTGLARQLQARSPQAIVALRRSVQIEGYGAAFDERQEMSPWLAASLLLSPYAPPGDDGYLGYSGYPNPQRRRTIDQANRNDDASRDATSSEHSLTSAPLHA